MSARSLYEYRAANYQTITDESVAAGPKSLAASCKRADSYAMSNEFLGMLVRSANGRTTGKKGLPNDL
jgi:hypothetical protein